MYIYCLKSILLQSFYCLEWNEFSYGGFYLIINMCITLGIYCNVLKWIYSFIYNCLCCSPLSLFQLNCFLNVFWKDIENIKYCLKHLLDPVLLKTNFKIKGSLTYWIFSSQFASDWCRWVCGSGSLTIKICHMK